MPNQYLTVALTCLTVSCHETVELTPLVPGTGEVVTLSAGGLDGNVGWWPDVVVDKSGSAHVSYCDVMRGDLMYATDTTGTWQVSTVMETGSVGKYTTITGTS